MAERAESAVPGQSQRRRWGKRAGWALGLLLAPFLLAALFFATPIGKRFIADQIAAAAPASGLRFTVGRIEGDIYRQAVLRQVTVSDPKGAFLTIPEVRLDWRPLKWLWSGLDIREVTARRGRLARLPELKPGDPDAPLLPDFDIRIDKLVIEDLVIAKGLATPRDERANLTAKVDIRQGRALIEANARLGAQDRFALLLDAEPDGDRFELSGDALAPEGGVIVGLAKLGQGYTARIVGDGTWKRWRGAAVARAADGAADQPVAAFRITNDAGRYGVLGELRAGLGDATIAGRALGETTALATSFTLEDSVIEGRAAAVSDALDARVSGGANLADKVIDGARVRLGLRNPDLFGTALRIEGGTLAASLTGAFGDLGIKHEIAVSRLAASGVTATGLAQVGSARLEGAVLSIPLTLTAERVTTGIAQADPRLVKGRASGLLTYDFAKGALAAERTDITFPGLNAQLSLAGDIPAGAYAVAGPVNAQRLKVEGAGEVTANAKVLAKFGPAVPWSLRANLAGVLSRIGNATIVNLAGEQVRFKGELGMGAGQPIIFRNTTVTAPRLTATLDSKVVTGGGATRTVLAGQGRQAQFGPFRFDAEIAGDGPRAVLVLADPYPAAGLKDVRIALAPSEEGFGLDVAGQSLLGEFDGALELFLPENAPTRIAINRLDVYRTNVTGDVTLLGEGISGDLRLAGGGVNGTLAFRPQGQGVIGFAVDLAARNASFGGATPITIARADIAATGRIADGSATVDADITAGGFEYGGLYLANLSAKAGITNGRGKVTGQISGRRADRFALNFDANVAPGQIAAAARGQYGNAAITMPRRAVLTAQDGGSGWSLAPTQIGFGGGFAIAEGTLGGGTTALNLQLSKMPLRLLDLAGADLGLGGRLTGIIDYRQTGREAPTARARGRIERFSRAGLVLSSKPINVLGVVDLRADRLTAAARLFEGEERRGEFSLAVLGLASEGAPDGALGERVTRGRLGARLAFNGAAETLWRLAAVEAFDLAGPVRIDARATGTLANPRITGNVASDDLTVQSALTGTRITGVKARGRFAGSRLELASFAGQTGGGGTVSGSGTVDLAQMSRARGPALDLRAAVKNARLLDANGLQATITGPLRIVSSGLGGTIAGRVTIDRARWALGNAAEDRALPRIATREINGEDGRARAQVSARDTAWRYLVNASAPGRVTVEGLGLESEWGIDIALRGTVADPRIGGTARLVRGDYTFAGTRFDLTRGRILFDVNEAINPRLDILAETARNGTNVDIAITGNAEAPAIAFSSDPALPEEEILARLLFGGSVTSLSATDAVQLAAALAALQGGGGGLDPIGTLRRSIGLDQLRIVSADPLTGRQTGIAIGKNITRSIYVELVTDGRGYSATQVEYRITSWLALLGTVSTIGRDSVLVQVSRDY